MTTPPPTSHPRGTYPRKPYMLNSKRPHTYRIEQMVDIGMTKAEISRALMLGEGLVRKAIHDYKKRKTEIKVIKSGEELMEWLDGDLDMGTRR